MIPRPIKVEAIGDYKLIINFDNGEKRVYDMKKNLDTPFYRDLKNVVLFNKVEVKDITIEWPTGQDICPNELYTNSIIIK